MFDICGYEFIPTGVCAKWMRFDIIDGAVWNVEIEGGCDGGHQGLAHMVQGRPLQEVISICMKVGCMKGNSCPKQLAVGLQECIDKMTEFEKNGGK